MVTAMVELSEASETEDITAGVPLKVQVYCAAAVLLLPEASVNTPAATFMLVKPSAAGVNVAVYTVLLVAENELIAPPTTVISLEIKFVVASLLVKVKVRVASFVVEPLDTALPPAAAVIAIVGGVPS